MQQSLRRSYTSIFIFILIMMVYAYSSAASVSIQPVSYSSYQGLRIQPYWINQNVPANSCNSPTVDTSTSQPTTGGSFSVTSSSPKCLWTPQFKTATNLPSSNFVIDFGVTFSPALDGSNIDTTSGISRTLLFTTAQAPDLVIVMIATGGTCASTCVTGTDGGGNTITFTRRANFTKRAAVQNATINLYEFFGQTQNSGTVSITVTLQSATNTVTIAFGISNAYLPNPFDADTKSNSSTGKTASVTINPPTLNDMVIGLLATTGNPKITNGIGYTLIQSDVSGAGQSAVGGGAEYNSPAPSGPQTVSFSLNKQETWIIIAEAIKGTSQPAQLTFDGYVTNPAGANRTILFTGQTVSFASNGQIKLVISISATTIPTRGYIEVKITLGMGSGVNIHWGSGGIPSNFQVTLGVETVG